MQIKGSVALVTGANRGLGLALTRALREQGADRVYAGARDVTSVREPGVEAVRLDVTDPPSITAAAARLRDVTIVVNNAGVQTEGSPLLVPADKIRADLDVNYLGPLLVARAFAPILATNGGGALVNILSVLTWTTAPVISVSAASKAASWSMTNALRLSLRRRGTLVVGVHCDTIETDMSRKAVRPKLDPREVAEAVLRGVADGAEEVLVDDHTRTVKALLSEDLQALYPVVSPGGGR